MRTCLVIDDSLVVRLAARRIFGDLRFEIREAENAPEALEACRREMPDAVLVDWNMPVMDGIDLVRRLRGMPGGGAPFVVLATAEGDAGHRRSALAAGADDCVVKPISADTLRAMFDHVRVAADRATEPGLA
jgi:two-component system chemotaxis response regulator CheY